MLTIYINFVYILDITINLNGALVRKSSYKKIFREVRGLRKLNQPNNHPNIVRYYSSWVDVAPTDDRKKIAPWKDMEGGKAM